MRKEVWVVAAALSMQFAARTADAAPTWCNVEGLRDKYGRGSDNVSGALGKKYDSFAVLVGTTCFPEGEAVTRKREIDAARAEWSKRLGMVETDWRDMAEFVVAVQNSWVYDTDIGLDRDTRHPYSKQTPYEQFAALYAGMNIPGGYGHSYSDWMYSADALGPTLTALGRFAFVLKCVKDDGPIETAICEGDIKLLDRKKILEEIRAEKTTGKMKMYLRMMLSELDEQLKDYNERVKKLKASDPAYAKMFEIAATTRKQWDDIWVKDKALVDAALEMDDARELNSRKVFESCGDKAWATWSGEVTKIPASKFVGFSTENTDNWNAPALGVINSVPQGYLASVVYYGCNTLNKDDDLRQMLGAQMAYWPGLRGPRFATQWNIQNAGLVLDDATAKIEAPSVRHDMSSRFHGEAGGGTFGTIAKVGAPDKNGMSAIKFAKKSEKQERCLSSRMTKRISQITANGTVIYYNDCLKWGVVAVDKTPNDQNVQKRYLTNLKPGTSAYIRAPVVSAVFPKGKKTPIAVFGVAVK